MIGSSRRFPSRGPASALEHEMPQPVLEATPVTLLPLTMASINHTLPGWLEERVTQGVVLTPGGWEEWAPVDLLAWLHESLGATARRRWDVQRGVGVFTEPERRAALVFNAATHDVARPMAVVGVVAESGLESRAAFLQRTQVMSEWLRPENVLPRYVEARQMVLALTVDRATARALEEHEFGVVAMTKDGCAAMWREVGV